MINNQLYKYLNIFVKIYFDNILIYSNILKKYKKYIKKILKKFKIIKLLLKLKKYNFYKEKITFLKYIVKRNDIQINLTKIATILE